jgi:hypothetical protein
MKYLPFATIGLVALTALIPDEASAVVCHVARIERRGLDRAAPLLRAGHIAAFMCGARDSTANPACQGPAPSAS